MNRRNFCKAAVGAAASVAIGMRLARGMPAVAPSVTLFQPSAGVEVMTEHYGDMGDKYARALARSMRETKEIKAANVMNRAFG